MDHEERIRKFQTRRDELSPEMQARLEAIDKVRRERREAGQYTPESLQQRHLSENILPKKKRTGEDEQPESNDDQGQQCT